MVTIFNLGSRGEAQPWPASPITDITQLNFPQSHLGHVFLIFLIGFDRVSCILLTRSPSGSSNTIASTTLHSNQFPHPFPTNLAALSLLANLQRLEAERQSNMSELTFAKTFLTTLDNKPTKYQPDHIFDPKTTALRIPYTLPRLPHPPHPLPPKTTPAAPVAPGSERADVETKFNLLLKSARNPSMSLSIADVSASTTVQSLKDAVQLHLGGASAVEMSKIKILLNKKPIPGSKKTLKEAMEGSIVAGSTVEMGVFVMGGAKDPVVKAEEVEKPATPVPEAAAGMVEGEGAPEKMEVIETKAESEVNQVVKVLGSEGFWEELRVFLQTKLGDDEGVKKVSTIFQDAWSKQGN